MSDLSAANPGRPRMRWGWFVALGIAQLVLGAIAFLDVVLFTIAGVIFIGALLVVGGVFQVVHAFMNRGWGAFVLHLLVGILYIFGGVLRIVIGVQHHDMPGWGMLIAGGVISLLVGVMLVLMLPWSGLWVVGTLIAVELIIHGVSWIQVGLALRKDPQRASTL